MELALTGSELEQSGMAASSCSRGGQNAGVIQNNVARVGLEHNRTGVCITRGVVVGVGRATDTQLRTNSDISGCGLNFQHAAGQGDIGVDSHRGADEGKGCA